MTRILLAGDAHGDLDYMMRIVEFAHDNQCLEIVHLGDWGFWWPKAKDLTPDLNESLKAHSIYCRFLDGNHDWHPRLRQLPRSDFNVASNITHQHRGTMVQYDSAHNESGAVFVFLGGAPSIDYRGRQEGTSWWPEEVITEADIKECLRYKGLQNVYLMTHDAPVLPPGIDDRPEDMAFYYRSVESRKAIGTVMDELRPKVLAHGHYHRRYDRRLFCGSGEPLSEVQIIGLDCNYAAFPKTYYILDV